MNVYIVMGTHLPEISRCIDHLVKSSKDLAPVEVHVPNELDWIAPNDQLSVKSYDPETVLWVMDPDSKGSCFIIIDPRADLLDQLENLADNLSKCLIEPVKILTFVDCEQVENSAKLKGWLDACIYYSDIVLLGNRTNTAKPFVREFQKQYERLCYPCLFMFLKGQGIPANSGEILTPGTRRITQMFDIPEESDTPEVPGMVIEASCDLELEETETDPFRAPKEDESAAHIPDPSEFIIFPQ